MGKRKKVPPIERGEVVEVPAAEEMDDDTFVKHLELRHRDECKIETHLSEHGRDIWLPMYRTFHDRLHRLAVPGQHDHEHEEEW